MNRQSALRLLLVALWPALASLLPLQAKAPDDAEFFVRAIADRDSIVAGDSCRVSFVLYSSAPVSDVAAADEPKVRHARLRSVALRRGTTAGHVVENGRRYYTLLWSQYVVVPQRMGTITLPSCRFKVVLNVPEAPRDPFEAFFGTMRSRAVKAEAASAKLDIRVVEKPRRTTQELLRGSGTVI